MLGEVKSPFGGVPWVAAAPRADEAVAAEDPPRDVLVGRRGLERPQSPGLHADDHVPVTDGVPGGLNPRDPGMPRSVSLVLLPAQQVRQCATSQLHDRRGRRRASMRPSVPCKHNLRIRKHLQPD